MDSGTPGDLEDVFIARAYSAARAEVVETVQKRN